MAEKEAIIQKWVKDQIEKKYGTDVYLFKVPQGPYNSRRGIPDLVMGIKGLFVAIEVKTDKGTLTKLQSHELFKISKAGCISLTIYGKSQPMLDVLFDTVEGLT